MKLHELSPKNPKPSRKRKGQGNATGNGTFGGRGMNGQNARAGGGVRNGFEGGQTPLIQRMPKMRGFTPINRVEAQVVSVGDLSENFKDGAKVDFNALVEANMVKKNNPKVKVLLNGEIDKKLNIEGLLVSKTAKEAIEKAGGTVA